MRQLISILTISLFAATQLFAQEKYTTDYKVQYKTTYHQDSLHLDQTDSDDLYLFTGTNFGLFMNYDVIDREKTIEKMKRKFGGDAVSMDINVAHTSSNPSFNKTFYKNLQSGKVVTVATVAKKEYVFEEPKTFVDWQVRDSTKTIKGYPVQKATTSFAGRDYVAWFTLEVPIPDGPYLFSGLPGLIVQLYDTKKAYDFKLKSLEKLDEPRTWSIPENAKEVTKAEFVELKKKVAKNALLSSDLSYMMSHTPGIGGSITTDENGDILSSNLKKNGKKVSKDELRRAYKKNLESQNNPIELK